MLCRGFGEEVKTPGTRLGERERGGDKGKEEGLCTSMMQSPAGLGPPSVQGGDAQQQQWIIMQQQQQQQQTGLLQSQQPHEEAKTLWVGDLQYWMDESYLHSCFVHTGEVFCLVTFFVFLSHHFLFPASTSRYYTLGKRNA